MKYATGKILSAIFLLLFCASVSTAHAQTPQQALARYISDLQKSPNDYALRERIIKHVQTMKPAPAVPEEARRYLVRGKAAFKGTREVKDFNEAAEEFKKALLYAPWLAEGYYNLGIIQDKAGLYADAMQNLKFYLMAAPNAPDTEKVKDLIYEIEYRQEKASKESNPAAIAAKKQNEYEDWLRKIDGRRYICRQHAGVIDVMGKAFVLGGWVQNEGYRAVARFEITGRVSSYLPPPPQPRPISWVNQVEGTYTISDDGERITQHLRYADGDVRDYIFIWQR